jgi:hypothetical protein
LGLGSGSGSGSSSGLGLGLGLGLGSGWAHLYGGLVLVSGEHPEAKVGASEQSDRVRHALLRRGEEHRQRHSTPRTKQY